MRLGEILAFLGLLVACETDAFNVDIKVPIVKKGPTDSYFGYSVAQHHVKHVTTGVGLPV